MLVVLLFPISLRNSLICIYSLLRPVCPDIYGKALSYIRKVQEERLHYPGVGVGIGGGGSVNKNVKVLYQTFEDLIFSKSSDGFSLYLV